LAPGKDVPVRAAREEGVAALEEEAAVGAAGGARVVDVDAPDEDMRRPPRIGGGMATTV